MAADRGDPTEDNALRTALVALAAVNGVVDAVSFLGLGGIFTAFMTGNILFLGFAAAGAPGIAPLAAGTALLVFVFGAIVGSRIWVALEGQWRSVLLVSATTSSTLLLAAALLALLLDPTVRIPGPLHYPVITLMAFAMGLRTMTVHRLGYGMVTTLVTGTMVTLLADSVVGSGHGSPYQPYRFATVVSVFAGGAVGAVLLLTFGPTVPLLLAAFGGIGAVAGYLRYSR